MNIMLQYCIVTGYAFRQKTTKAHTVQVDGGDQPVNKKEQQTLQQLNAQVKVLTKGMYRHVALWHQVKWVCFALNFTLRACC